MKNTLETRLGLFVALVMLATFFVLVILGGLESFQPGLHVHALFDGAQELKVGDRVRMAGVEIGKVEKISADYTNNKVRVTMKIRKEIDHVPVVVKTDSTATIKFAGLMGQSFVALDFGTKGEPLKDAGFVATAEQPDISAVVKKLDIAVSGFTNVTKVFAGDSMNNLFSTLYDFIKRNSDPLTATISNLNSASAQIAAGQGTIGNLINDCTLYTNALITVSNLQAGISNFQSTSDEIRATVVEGRKVIEGINAGQGTLGKLAKDEKLYTDTTAAMTNLKEILEKMNNGQGTVGKLINDQEFYKNAKLTLQKIDKATEELEDSGPLSVLNAVVGKLF